MRNYSFFDSSWFPRLLSLVNLECYKRQIETNTLVCLMVVCFLICIVPVRIIIEAWSNYRKIMNKKLGVGGSLLFVLYPGQIGKSLVESVL